MSKLFALVVAVVAAEPGREPAAKADDPKLEGSTRSSSAEKDGKAIARGARSTGTTVRFTGDKIVGAAKDGKEFIAATYTLDRRKKPS